MKITKRIISAIALVTVMLVCAGVMPFTAFAAPTAPQMTSSDIDLVPYAEYKTYGKLEDDEDGKRLEITESKNGVTTKFNSQASDYGIRFENDYIKPDGTLYYSFRLDPENDLWEGGTNHIYGGPKIQLAKVMSGSEMFSGYLTIQFTQGDGIDFRFSDKIGGDLAYIGASVPGLKVDYPDTKSKTKGNNGYEVVIKLSKIGVSVWVNGTNVVDDIHFDSLYTSSGEKYPFEWEEFAPGVYAVGTRTTVHDFRLWCSASDTTVKINSSSNNTTSNTTSQNTSSSVKVDKDNNTSSDTQSTASEKEDTTDVDNTEIIIEGADGESTFVKGERVEMPNVAGPALIISGIVLALGALAVILKLTVFK